MLWKRKKKERPDRPLPPLFTRALTQVNGRFIGLAAALQKATSKLSTPTLKGLLCLFCLLFVLASGYVTVDSLREKTLSIRVTPIQTMPLAERPRQQAVITKSEFSRLQQLRSSLDSLSKTPSGKAIFDSIQQRHPGILDTLRMLETLYYNQH